jgi:hypothetical protein
MMSISPLDGHPPYELSLGIIQIAANSQLVQFALFTFVLGNSDQAKSNLQQEFWRAPQPFRM